MNTLVVLSALAAIAIAAPTSPENYYNGYRPLSYQITPTFRREKKSPIEAHNDAAPVLEVSQNLPHSELSQAHEVSARTFGLKKKPIIVKNKLGYHLYRDSDEEQAQADSQEKCTKEVKVKLCDEENVQAKSSKLNTNLAASEANVQQAEDMKHNIKMAKETVENLQKMSHWKQSEFGSDAELHKDIEVARQALAHIQQNLGNIESMNMRTTILNDAEALQEAQLQIAKDERMAQWKEAIANIQKNTEIAKNLEHSFSSANEHLSQIEKTDMTKQELSSDLKNVNEDKMLKKKNEKLDFNPKEANMEHEQLHEVMKAAPEIKEATTMTENEQKTIPRNDMPVKAFEELSQDKDKSDLLGQNIHTEMHKEAKSSDLDSSLKRPVAAVLGNEVEAKESSVKSAEPIKMNVETNKLKELDNAEEVLISANDKLTSTMKSAEVNHNPKQHNVHEFVTEDKSKALEDNLKNSKSVSIQSDDKNIIAKASEHVIADNEKKAKLMSDSLTHEKTANLLSSISGKSSEHHDMNNLHKQFNENKIHFQNTAAKSVDQTAHMSEQVISRVLAPVEQHHSETDLTAKMAVHHDAEHQHQLHNFHPQGKAWQAGQVASMKNAGIEQNTVNFDSHLQAKNWQAGPMASMKSSAVEQSISDLHNPEMQRTISNFSPMPHHFPTQHQTHFSDQTYHHQVHHPSQLGHLHTSHHGFPFKAAESLKEKAAEMDNSVQSTLQVNTNEQSGKTALEHNTNWKQQQVGAARGAYGAYGLGGAGVGAIGASIGAATGLAGGSSGGSGAIGVFPHANTGGCAIPLLLSCSPSVVSGSLAKTHSGYGAPAYRAGENFNFHTKRDTKKSNEITAAKVQRSPTKVIQKIPYTSNKKN